MDVGWLARNAANLMGAEWRMEVDDAHMKQDAKTFMGAYTNDMKVAYRGTTGTHC
jgi:hypothetical protein